MILQASPANLVPNRASASSGTQNTQPQWLSVSAWHSAFPQIRLWQDYTQELPKSLLAQLCSARLGQAPATVVVEQPWQAQWLTQQCMSYFSLAGVSGAPLPQVKTLGQWQTSDAIALQLDDSSLMSERQAALSLCNALKGLTIDSIRSDSARYALAVDIVAMLKEIDTRAALSLALGFAGQEAGERLMQTTWRSREAQWVAAARQHLESLGMPLAWQVRLQAGQRLAATPTLTAVFPAPHPSLAMQTFLSQLPSHSKALVGLPQLANEAQTALRLSAISVSRCEQFEHEAIAAATLIQGLMNAEPARRSVVVVAHDRVLARRCAALLARNQVPVEDRVGWALSTTVSSTVLRSVLSSWQGSDVPALKAWLGLPMVAAHWPHAKACLAHLRQRWHKEPILPEGREFIRQAIDKAPSESVKQCLRAWQSAQNAFLKPSTVAQHASALQGYLAPLSAAMLCDAAGAKVWQHLSLLTAETDATLISLATFVAVLDEALESERFSASTHNHDAQSARVIFTPLYEAAWTGNAPVVMLGCNEAHFPAAPRSPTPLLNSVRRELGLPLPSTERAVWQHLLAQADQAIYATFTPSEKGNPSRLSPWLLGAQPNGAALNSTSSAHERTTPIQLQTAQLAVQTMPAKVSVTTLAAVLQCPYRFALQAVFGLKSLDEPALWPAQAERGSLLHAALHLVHDDLKTLNNAHDLEVNIKAALQAVLQDKVRLSGRYAALVVDSQRTLATFVSAQTARQQEGWRAQATEHPIESEHLIQGTLVHGKIDRLDVMRDNTGEPVAYAVLDYKTSNEALLKKKMGDPLQDAQLALYAALAELNDLPPAQAAYWRLHDGLHESSAAKSDYHGKKTIFQIDDLPLQLDAVRLAVQNAWQSIASHGAAPATPSENACQYCAYKSVCRSSDLMEGDDE